MDPSGFAVGGPRGSSDSVQAEEEETHKTCNSASESSTAPLLQPERVIAELAGFVARVNAKARTTPVLPTLTYEERLVAAVKSDMLTGECRQPTVSKPARCLNRALRRAPSTAGAFGSRARAQATRARRAAQALQQHPPWPACHAWQASGAALCARRLPQAVAWAARAVLGRPQCRLSPKGSHALSSCALR